MDLTDGPLAQAERHVREAEVHVARQTDLIARLERDGHKVMAEEAREVLATLLRTLVLARDHLRIENEMYGSTP